MILRSWDVQVTRKNPKTVPNKMVLRKYDPVVRQHVLFTETKKFK